MLSSYLRKKVGGKRMSSGHVAAISTLGVASLFGTYCVGELLYVILRTPRLPRAPGPLKGGGPGGPGGAAESDSSSVKLLCLGDSVAVGCGLKSNDEACAGNFARAAEKALGRPVSWEVVGKNGVTAKQIETKFVPKIGEWCDSKPDIIVLSVGVNNLLAMQSEAHFEKDLTQLLRSIVSKVDGHSSIVLMGMPPMSMFVALTPLLRKAAGYKAKQFNQVMARVCERFQAGSGGGTGSSRQVVHADYQDSSIGLLEKLETESPASFFAPDGFHPGPKALQYMAEYFFEKSFAAKCTQLHSLVNDEHEDGGKKKILHRISFTKR